MNISVSLKYIVGPQLSILFDSFVNEFDKINVSPWVIVFGKGFLLSPRPGLQAGWLVGLLFCP